MRFASGTGNQRIAALPDFDRMNGNQFPSFRAELRNVHRYGDGRILGLTGRVAYCGNFYRVK